MSAALDAERDYSGVPTVELAAAYEKYVDCDFRTFAKRTGIDERDLRKYLMAQNYAFTGLRIADLVVTSLGQNLGHLVEAGELHIVPAARGQDNGRGAARMMIEDSFWIQDLDLPTDEQMSERVEELMELRRTLCVPSEEQRERLRRDSERAQQNRAAKATSGLFGSTLALFAGKLAGRHQTGLGQLVLRHHQHIAMVHSIALIHH